MFARSVRAGCRRISRRGVQTSSLSQKVPRRRYSNASPSPAPNTTQSPVAALGGLTSELDKLSPRFDINASQITILKDPSEFYETLKASIFVSGFLRLSFSKTYQFVLYTCMVRNECRFGRSDRIIRASRQQRKEAVFYIVF